MKITRKQLRKIILETFFVNPEGEAIDLSSGDQPIFTDKRVKKMINHPDENLRDMARKDPEHYRHALNLAAYGYGDEGLELTPEEEMVQSLHDEFGVDSEYGYRHVSRNKNVETDWDSLIQQLRPAVEAKIQAAIDSGIKDSSKLTRIMNKMPAYKALARRIHREAGFDDDDILNGMRRLADNVMIDNHISLPVREYY